MTLQPGSRFVIAPHFPMPTDWSRRLAVGTRGGEHHDAFVSAPFWRPPTTDELAVLVGPPAASMSSAELETCISLFQLPGHVRLEWWKLLKRAAGTLGDARLPGFEQFVSHIAEFLAFKDLPLPEGGRCDVVVSYPGRHLVPSDLETASCGEVQCHLAPWSSAEEQRSRLWGGINLGEEETSVVLINLPCQGLEAERQRRYPNQPPAATVNNLAQHFLRVCSDFPPVRLILRPGEGFRLPRCGLILASDPGDKQEPAVLLWIFHDSIRSS